MGALKTEFSYFIGMVLLQLIVFLSKVSRLLEPLHQNFMELKRMTRFGSVENQTFCGMWYDLPGEMCP